MSPAERDKAIVEVQKAAGVQLSKAAAGRIVDRIAKQPPIIPPAPGGYNVGYYG